MSQMTFDLAGLRADLLRLVPGTEPISGFHRVCLREQVAPEVHLVGDALAPATVAEAVRAGHAIGRLLWGLPVAAWSCSTQRVRLQIS